MKLKSFIESKWIEGQGEGVPLFHAVNGERIFEISSQGIDMASSLNYARQVGGKVLRKMTFHERGRMLKALAQFLLEKKETFYELSKYTGATRRDSWIDIEGGIGTLFVYSSKGRREFPNETFYVEGDLEPISKGGTFIGRHICVPLEGVAVHINAFNFPCWGMLEKLAPTLLAGMPAIIKPASSTAYLTERMVRSIIESNILPPGSLQLICGSTGDLLDHVTCQDVVTFTGSAETGLKLKQHPTIVKNATRFNMESDSLNFSVLAPDVTPDKEEFKYFIKEVVNEMTVKAGQKCTAIRRTFVPQNLVGPVQLALKERLATIKIGNPEWNEVNMGPLANKSQVDEVRKNVEKLMQVSELIYGNVNEYEILGGDKNKGAYFPSTLLYCPRPFEHEAPHSIEAFGPVNTVMPYKNIDEVIELAKKGQGSLVGSLFTTDNEFAREIVLGTASYHGRIVVINKDCIKESTGHGSPLPHLVHGGPGRAGGGEEMGGIRAVLHYMQRTALQGSPTTLSAITNEWMEGSQRHVDRVHPFKKHFEELRIGEALITHRRTITEADIVNFAGISGDFFYAHMDELAAKDSLFKQRVAHGYFVISAAAGLFVEPSPGPVLANYGLERLRFIEPVKVGDTIQVKLTCKQKILKDLKEGEGRNGVVAWHVDVTNQEQKSVAVYSILTLVKCMDQA